MMAPGVEGEEFHLPLCLSQLPSAQVHLYLSQGSMIESPQTRDGPYHLHLDGTCELTTTPCHDATGTGPACRQARKGKGAAIVVVLVLLICAGTQTGNFAACVQPALFSPLSRSQVEGARYAAWCVCCLNCWGRKTKRWKKANRRFSHHHHIQGVVVWKH